MPERTDDYLRLPQHPGTTYTETWQGVLSEADGIDVLFGIPQGATASEVRTLLFRLDHGWTWEKVKTWVQAHSKFTMPKTFAEIPDVEVFRPGTWKGRDYTDADMDRIADNSNAMLPYFRAKLKLSHTPDEEQPAFIQNAALGIAANYSTKIRDGVKRVYAHFRNVPPVLAQAIQQFYPERSVEKYQWFRHPDTGEQIPDVIASVAFLGHMPPEVKGMFDDFAVLYAESEDAERHGDCDRYEWRDDPADVVFTSPNAYSIEPSTDDQAHAEDSKEPLRMKKDVTLQDQPQDLTEDQTTSVKDSPTDDRVMHQTVNVTVPDTSPDRFSEADLDAAKDAARQEAEDAFQEERTKFQDDLDHAQAEIAALKAEQADQVLTHEIETFMANLALPESFQKLGVSAFLKAQAREDKQCFAEGEPERSLFEQCQALLSEVSKFWELYASTLSSEQAPEPSDRRRNQDQQRAELFQNIRTEHPDIPETEVMKLAAEQHPDLFEEKEEIA